MNDEAKMRGQSIGLLSMLAVQFVLGMILNPFVTLPKPHPGTSGGFFERAVHSFGWALTNGGGIALTLHVLVAIGLLIGSITMVVRAVAVKSRPWLITSIIGALSVITALTNGLSFIGYDRDTDSFMMAIGYIVAVVSYTIALSFAPSTSFSEKHVQDERQEKIHGKLKPSHS